METAPRDPERSPWPGPAFATYRVLGVRIDAVQISDVVASVGRWIDRAERGKFIAVAAMHTICEARGNAEFKAILNDADLVVPDGKPLVLLGRLKGHALERRVYGPDLMLRLCQESASRGDRQFFYGGAPGVAQRLAEVLVGRFPGLRSVGSFSPPYRELTPQESRGVAAMINRAAPDILWIGLGSPKQERFIKAHRASLDVPVLIAIGAAFDLNLGRVRQAPIWMREGGVEWLWRLAQEPRRLWRRYLLQGPRFVWDVAREISGLKRFD